MTIVLASGSEWRKELLSWLGVDFQVIESGFDEMQIVTQDPEDLVTTLAWEKARRVADRLQEGLVIGADTVIVLNPDDHATLEIIGKPANENEARETLRKLRGREHVVYTGVAVLEVETNERWIELETTRVRFKDISDQMLEKFLQTDIWRGKAGAYQFLAVKDTFLDSVEGSVTGVIGLPLRLMASILAVNGIQMPDDLETIVWEKTGYQD